MSPQPATRRRGPALIEAIYRATLAELERTSFAELSFDRIAAAAGTGKAALYRRWTGPEELVLAALTDPVTGFGGHPPAPGTGHLRDDLITLFTGFAETLDTPLGRALRPLLAQRNQHPELLRRIQDLVIRPAQEVLLAVLGEAVTRGEAEASRVTPRTVGVGPRLLLIESWMAGKVTEAEVIAVVDEVLLPMFSAPT